MRTKTGCRSTFGPESPIAWSAHRRPSAQPPITRAVSSTGVILALLGLVALLTATSSLAATLYYDFSGGLQGWTQIGTTSRAPWNPDGNSWGSTGAGSVFGYDGDDAEHATYWVRSPAFQIDGSGPLQVRFWGGKANTTAPANEAAVPASSLAGVGFKGVVLREVTTGNFVASLSQTSDGAQNYYSLSAAQLAGFANNGKVYTLDFLDYDHGGWGWVGLDNVTVPGALMQITLTPSTPNLFNGSSATVTVTIPLGVNASAPFTVFVTNSSPGALTFNGSADPVVPVVFAVGAANSQDLPVTATGPGYVRLTGGGEGLESGSGGLTVLLPSGLLGRWITGSQDLQDKAGYSPAGTHDGVVANQMTASFSADVPPGAPATAMSLDVGTTANAVIISNTATMDPGYRATFDDGTVMQLSVVFWAKGSPGNWNPFLSKWGEGSTGWQVRRRGDSIVSTFTLRATGGEDDPYNGSTAIDDWNWHHFAAVWDGVAGVRKLYVDGKLNNVVPNDRGPMGLAKANYLTLGGRTGADSANPGALFSGLLFDLQIYGLPLSGSAVQRLFTADSTSVLAFAETPVMDLARPGTVSVSIPSSANASAPVTVYVTNTTPAVIDLAGSVGNVLALTFPAGGVTSQTVTLTGLSEGQGKLDCAATGLTGGSVTVQVYGPHLIGHWLNGTESLTDLSGFAAAGKHDGYEAGAIGTLTFSTDAPPSKPGKAAQFGGSVGMVIGNSSLLDPDYAPTFDDVIGRQFSVAFWAKGAPGTWNPWISKRGEEAIGWQVRRSGGLNQAFTIRGTGSGNEDGVGSASITDGKWHHYTAVWDGWSGTRKCYVDGVLDPSINLTNDFAPMTMAPNQRLMIGARAPGQVTSTATIEGAFNGLIYDVRMYNYPLGLTEISNLSFVAAIKVIPSMTSLEATKSMPVDVVLPAGANQGQQVVVQVRNDTPALVALTGAVGDIVTLTYPIGGSLTQQVTVVGIADGKAKLTATGGGFAAGVGTFNVWADPGTRLIGRWLSGGPDLIEKSGFRPAGTHDGTTVGANAQFVSFSTDVPPSATPGDVSLDLSVQNAAVMINNSSVIEPGYVETFDAQMARKFSITFWAKGTPNTGDWNPWISKRGENGQGYQVRRYGGDNPIRPTFTIRGTAGDDDPWINTTVDGVAWHHYAATWDSATGIRRLYLDGVPILGLSRDTGPMNPALADHLMLGGRDYNGFGNYFPGLLYDVRIYSYALSQDEVAVAANPPVALSLSLARTNVVLGSTVKLTVSVPASATSSSALTVYLTNNSPSVVTIVGSTGNVFPVTFPVGSNVQVVQLQAIGLGQIDISASGAGVGAAVLSTINMVVQPNLVGRWLTGAPTLQDASGFSPAGTHDGQAVGPNAAALAFAADVPPGFLGQSLDLRAGNVGVAVANSANTDPGYQPTFDTRLAPNFTVAFWAKGMPGDWAPWIAKRGEDGIGWQLRRMGGDPIAGFTLRGVDNDDGWGSAINVNDNPPKWRHFAGVWDQATGTRTLYVDGVASHIVFNNPSQVMTLAPGKHLGIGARESGGTDYEAYFSGLLFDVRIYDYPLTADEVSSIVVAPPLPPNLSVQAWTGTQVRIAWPASFTGYGIEQTTALPGGWEPSGLPVTLEGSENAAYAPAATGNLFFRLKKQ